MTDRAAWEGKNNEITYSMQVNHYASGNPGSVEAASETLGFHGGDE